MSEHINWDDMDFESELDEQAEEVKKPVKESGTGEESVRKPVQNRPSRRPGKQKPVEVEEEQEEEPVRLKPSRRPVSKKVEEPEEEAPVRGKGKGKKADKKSKDKKAKPKKDKADKPPKDKLFVRIKNMVKQQPEDYNRPSGDEEMTLGRYIKEQLMLVIPIWGLIRIIFGCFRTDISLARRNWYRLKTIEAIISIVSIAVTYFVLWEFIQRVIYYAY